MMEAPKEELPFLFLVYGSSKNRDAYLRATMEALFFSSNMVAARTEILICGQ